MNRVDLINALARGGFFRGDWSTLDDVLYDAVSPAFVLQAWEVWVQSLPNELVTRVPIGGDKTGPVPKWLPEVFDCDNIAVDFAVFLGRCLAVDAVNTGRARGNLGGGRFNFLLGGAVDKGHCRTWFIDHDGVAHAFDAGNGQMDGMTAPELESIFSGESV